MLFIIETHGASGDSVEWKVTKDLMSSSIEAAVTLGTDGVSQTTFASSTDALNAFNLGQRTNYTNAIASYLSSNRYVFARLDWFYSFTDAGDSNTLKEVYWPLLIYPDGTVRDLGMRVISATPRVLYYVYHSLATADNLPAGWTYPDGGVLYKYVLDKGLNIISSTTVNTNGLYDPPAVGLGDSTTNPNQGLELLISQVAVPDMNRYSALYSIIDYSPSVAPAYNCDAAGKCTAIIAVQSLARILNISVGCSTYENQGETGYTLEYQTQRYMVQPSGSYTQTATSTGYDLSPTQNFDKTVAVPDSTTAGGFANTIIDPFTTNTLYNFTNDTVNNLPCNQYLHNGTQCAQSPITVTGVVTSCN